MKTRLLHFLIALDRLLYVALTLGYGSPDDTLSSAAWRMEAKGRWQGRVFRPLIDWLFASFEPDHCQRSYFSIKDDRYRGSGY